MIKSNNTPLGTSCGSGMEQYENVYFAYGSNMNPERMQTRGVKFVKRELAELPGYRFVLNKVIKSNGTAAANIIEDSLSSVYGAMYTCDNQDVFQQLDKFEGVSSKQYHRKEVTVYLENKITRKAQVYIALEHVCRDNLKVHPEYFKHILTGKDILPLEYVDYLKSFEGLLINDN